MTLTLSTSGGRGDTAERGVTLILMALLMVALITIVAIVVDIAMVRSDRTTNQSAADFASTAGVQDLDDGPWAAVCSAYDYLREQEVAFQGLSLSAGTCSPPAVTVCDADDPSTWAGLVATSADGSITVEILSPYDPSADVSNNYPEEAAHAGDPGVPCQQVGVRIAERRDPMFASVIGAGSMTTHIRSVARTEAGRPKEPAALILLERRDCNVIQTGGSNTQVIARAQESRPGIIHMDSDASGSCSAQPIINGQSTSSGPSILACSTDQAQFGCSPTGASPNVASIIGVVAAKVNPGGNIARAYSEGRYGDTPYRGADLFTRGAVDERYGQPARALDARMTTLFARPSTANPPGCGPVDPLLSTCISGSETWVVLSGDVCAPAQASALAPLAQNVWFNCGDYSVNAELTLPLARKVIFNGGDLNVTSTLSAPMAREVLVRGRDTGNKVGLRVGNGGQLLLNHGSASQCAGFNPGQANTLGLFRGTYDVRSGGYVRTCFTFAFLASGGNKVPSSNGTPPCPSVDNPLLCDGYTGNFNLQAGGLAHWTAPDLESRPFCQPGLPADVDCYEPTAAGREFEDLALWTEAAISNALNGGASSRVSGIFFLPNADEFSLAGGGSLPIELNAQFITRKLHISGGATLALTPDPNDAITVPTSSYTLVR
jgi:hypothetical protein